MDVWRKESKDIITAANRRLLEKGKSSFDSGVRERAAEKKCSICKDIKPAAEFYLSNTNKDGLHGWCKVCSDRRTVENGRKRLYGVTPEIYERMLAKQNGKCAICGTTSPGKNKSFSVDHCHSTGLVRGLLCSNCNALLGYAKDKQSVLLAAVTYLEENEI